MRKVFFVLFLFQALAAIKPFLPTKRGDYAACFPEELNKRLPWVSKFNLVEVGGVDGILLTREEISRLKNMGVKEVIFYDWAPAGYHYLRGGDNPLMKWVYQNKDTAALNPQGPFPHCEEMGYGWCQDFYFDFGLKEVIRKKTDFLWTLAQRHGYSGIFFDWAPGVFILEPEYRPMLLYFKSRHGGSYLQAIGKFYRNLKNKHPGLLVVTNQGFRNGENVLPHTDYDMTESYGTGEEYFGRVLNVEGRGIVEVPDTVYYPVSDDFFNGSLEDSVFYLDYLYKLWEKFRPKGFKNFLYMNYAAPEFLEAKDHIYRPVPPRNAIFFGYALAKLRGFMAYTEVPFDRKSEEVDLYFYDLGKPLGRDYEEIPGGYVRFYTHGFVVVGEWEEKTRIEISSPFLLNGAPVYDLYREKWTGTVKDHEIEIVVFPEMDRLTGRMAPCGRVFLYPSSRMWRKYR